MPFGVQKPFVGRGDRDDRIEEHARCGRCTSASLRWCACERSRWNGVGSTLSIGRIAIRSAFLPSGSL